MSAVCGSPPKVARRQAYKGNVSDLTCLPVDCYTSMGLLVMLATLLPATSFSSDGIHQCVAALKTLEEHMCLNCCLQLLPHAELFKLQLQENALPVSQVKAVLKELGLSWSRWDHAACQPRLPLMSVVCTPDAGLQKR